MSTCYVEGLIAGAVAVAIAGLFLLLKKTFWKREHCHCQDCKGGCHHA